MDLEDQQTEERIKNQKLKSQYERELEQLLFEEISKFSSSNNSNDNGSPTESKTNNNNGGGGGDMMEQMILKTLIEEKKHQIAVSFLFSN